jgi:hypothetical protein
MEPWRRRLLETLPLLPFFVVVHLGLDAVTGRTSEPLQVFATTLGYWVAMAIVLPRLWHWPRTTVDRI